MNSLSSNVVRGRSAVLLTALLLKGKVIFLIVTLMATSYSVFLLPVCSPLISATLMTTANFYHDH